MTTPVTFDDLKQIFRRIDVAGGRLRRLVDRMSNPDELMECDRCGHQATARTIDTSAAYVKLLAGPVNPNGPWGDSEPAEYVTVCPGCGAEESFDKATPCAECGERPCLCD